MKQIRHEIIIRAIEKLSSLTGEDFHGYKSEIYDTLLVIYEEAKENINVNDIIHAFLV